MPKRAKTDTVHLRLRVRVGLLDRFRAEALRNKVPLTTEIVNQLEEKTDAKAIIVAQREDRQVLLATIEKQTAQIEKLTAQVERLAAAYMERLEVNQ
jgi:hypothetical protein